MMDDNKRSFVKIAKIPNLNNYNKLVNLATNDINFYLLDEFYYEYENREKLSTNFFQRIVELENVINRDDQIVASYAYEELAYLYKVY